MRVIRDAEEFVRAHPGQPLYPEQVCASIGVSYGVLHQAFMTHFAASPHALLERRRLYLMRSCLDDRGDPQNSFRTLALAFGFWNLEALQQDYRASFGRSVLDT